MKLFTVRHPATAHLVTLTSALRRAETKLYRGRICLGIIKSSLTPGRFTATYANNETGQRWGSGMQTFATQRAAAQWLFNLALENNLIEEKTP